MTSVGVPLERVDGHAKVTGQASYAADAQPGEAAVGLLVGSTIAKGRIVDIDAAEAASIPGVIAILTQENMPPLHDVSKRLGEQLMPLSSTTIYYAGQTVAMVVAESFEIASDAARRIHIRYEGELPLLDLAAAEASATLPQSALGGGPAQHSRGDVDLALAEDGIVKIEATYITPVETNNPMEPSATTARWAGSHLSVEDSTQAVVSTRNLLADAFGLQRSGVRVLCPFTGGGFGAKGHQWPHTLLAAAASRAVGRPVRLELTRAQMFTSVGHRPPIRQQLVLGARKDGTLVAIRHATLSASSPCTEFAAPCGAVTSKLMYACANVDTPSKLARLNIGASTPMRAPAECPGSFACESAMDELAVALRMDPIELRLKNYAERDPSNGKPWSSNFLRECYARGADRFGWAKRPMAPRSMTEGGLLVGWGMATASYPAKRLPAAARIRFFADGHALVQAATQELGTGSYTVFSQIAADAMGLPVEAVHFQLGDTDLPESPMSAGSMSAASVSEAIVQAAISFQQKVAAIAAADLESPLAGLKAEELALRDGALVVLTAPSRRRKLVDVLKRAGLPTLEAEASVKPEDPKTSPVTAQSFGAQFCEVKVDPQLGQVRVTRFVSVHDPGRILNPRTSTAQVVGALVMGIGMALMEETVYDPRNGRPVTDNFADYRTPVQMDIGAIEVEFIDRPDPHLNTLGCRGVGEIGITGAAAAIANAVYHATGVRLRELPLTPDKLLAAKLS
jgi:xanthine dehydrogenase YagR molybdenum-binding subunit